MFTLNKFNEEYSKIIIESTNELNKISKRKRKLLNESWTGAGAAAVGASIGTAAGTVLGRSWCW